MSAAPFPPAVARSHALHRRVARRRHDYWSLALLEGPDIGRLAPVAGVEQPVLRAEDVTDSDAGFVADPFWLPGAERHHLFFEVYNWKRDRGEIGLATSRDGRDWEYARIVMRESTHLSFPFVFEDDGTVFMIPESHQRESVRLYRAVDFPVLWREEAVLLSGRAFVDPVLVRHEDRYYLFVSDTSNRVLYLFHADRLTGPWNAHPASPVRRDDARHSRPAGRFVHDGVGFVRLAQSAEPFYGAFVSAFRIERLDAAGYAESPLEPYPLLAGTGEGWCRYGAHHLDARRCEDGTWRAVADGLDLRRFRPRRYWPWGARR